jgi:hypothetical protein
MTRGSLEQHWSTRTGSDGRAVLADLPIQRRLDVLLRSAGREQRVYDLAPLEPGEVRAVTWTWGGGCTI